MPPTPPSPRPAPTVDRWTALRRGTSGRCPRCAAPDLFRSPYRLHERCPHCGLPLEMEDGWSYGSVPLAYALACVVWVLPVVLLALFGVLGPLTAGAVGVAGVVILPIVTFRFTKKLWTGLYYAILPHELRERPAGQRGDLH
ncbi:MAG: DUF983 domain-containing protein [Verrucomicrobiota bacterium]